MAGLPGLVRGVVTFKTDAEPAGVVGPKVTVMAGGASCFFLARGQESTLKRPLRSMRPPSQTGCQFPQHSGGMPRGRSDFSRLSRRQWRCFLRTGSAQARRGHSFCRQSPPADFSPQLKGVSVDPGTALALIAGYIAAAIGVFVLYSPVLFLVVGLLLAAGLLQLLAWPFLVLIRKLRRKPEPPQDGSWLLH
jgi:hypothetical protein